MTPTVNVRCCRVWPVVPGYPIGRCGLCREAPSMSEPLMHVTVHLLDGTTASGDYVGAQDGFMYLRQEDDTVLIIKQSRIVEVK